MGTHPLICIRTDGNHTIASGHLMRCLSIARACKSLGMEVCFLVCEGESFSLLESFTDAADSFRAIPLKTAVYDHLEQELPEVTLFLRSLPKKPVYLLDSYYVTEHYLTAINPLAKVAFLDDLQLFDYPVDLLVNYDVIPDDALSSYKAAYRNSRRLLLGAAYAPLRCQFQDNPIPLREQVKDLLVTTGGSDPFHFCLRFLQAISQNLPAWPFSDAGITIHIVIGKMNTDKEALHSLAASFPFPHLLKLHENVTDMASLMRSCDLAISAAGTTLYELCALGIPAISFTMADNQLAAAKAFDTTGAIPCAGDIRLISGNILQPFVAFLASMSGLSPSPGTGQSTQPDPGQHMDSPSYAARKVAHEAMRRLVDGKGALRIAEALGGLWAL